MALVEMVMPKMGESIMEGTILTWLKKVGDTIDQDESVLEVATDKVDTEVPATHAGVLTEILANEGDIVEVGKAIAVITTEGEQNGAKKKAKEQNQSSHEHELTKTTESAGKATLKIPARTGSGKFLSPLVRKIASEEGISLSELEYLDGSGKEGRITKSDILALVESRKTSRTAVKRVPANHPVSINAEDEIIAMDRMRKMIAERMVASKQISAHVTSFAEADVTGLVSWRDKWKNDFKARENQSLTYTPVFIEAVIKAIKDYPMMNISVDGDTIIKRGQINIGMAVALPTGNLIVPVIHEADQYNLKGLVKKVNELAVRARENRLQAEELSRGTYTVSNVGSFGNVMGTPIIMQPQVGILALGAIAKKPAVIETETGDAIGIRSKMFLSHSYDHRVIDGALGGMFVRRVADYLEQFDTSQRI